MKYVREKKERKKYFLLLLLIMQLKITMTQLLSLVIKLICNLSHFPTYYYNYATL